MEQIVGTLSSRVTQLEVRCETKTLDNVFVDVIISIQYKVNEGFSDPNDKLSSGVYKAFYELSDPKKQITAYVYDVVRSSVPKIELDNVFLSKNKISAAIKEQLRELLAELARRALLRQQLDPHEAAELAVLLDDALRKRQRADEKAAARRRLQENK